MSGVSVDPASGLFDEVWAEATWEWKDRTVGWAINRPTPAALHQLDAVAAMGIPPAMGLPARSLIDAAIGTDSWGLTATWGLSSVETALETNSNMMLDLVAGFNSGTDLEIAPYFSWSHLGFVPDGAEDNAFLVGANLRKGISWDYFNQLVVGFEYSSGTTSTAADSIDAPTSIVADAQFTMYENDMMTGDGDHGKLTYLFNLGFGIASVDDGMPSSDRQTNFFVDATAGGEYGLTGWLDMRGSVTRTINLVFVEGAAVRFAGPTVAAVGATGHWGQFGIEALVNNALFESGPDFIGGNANGISSFVSAYYHF